MKKITKIILFSLAIFAVIFMESCANARVSAGMGVDVSFGPNGPRVTPDLNVSVYNGGRF